MIEKPATTETPTERGHWRCVFIRMDPSRGFTMDRVKPGGGWLREGAEWVVPERYPTQDVAEAEGRRLERLTRLSPRHGDWRFDRAEFFPDL